MSGSTAHGGMTIGTFFLKRADGDVRPAEWAEVQQDQLGVLELEEVRRALNQLDPKGRAHRDGDGVRAAALPARKAVFAVPPPVMGAAGLVEP